MNTRYKLGFSALLFVGIAAVALTVASQTKTPQPKVTAFKPVASTAIKAQQVSEATAPSPYIGISYLQISPQVATFYGLSEQSGVLVTEVAKDSPAAKAGIVPNSIITGFDCQLLDGDVTPVELVMLHKAGDEVNLAVVPPSGGAAKQVTLVLAPGQ